MPKKYDLKVIQAYFDDLGVAQLGEVSGEDFANLLVTLGWHTDDDLHRTATNCLAWVRKKVKFEEVEAGVSPSKLVKACVKHVEQEVLPKEDGSENSDEASDREDGQDKAKACRLAKAAAKAKITATAVPDKKPQTSTITTTSDHDGNATMLAMHTQQILALYSELQHLHHMLQEMVPVVRDLRGMVVGGGHGLDACGGQAPVAMVETSGHGADASAGEAATAAAASQEIGNGDGLAVPEEEEKKQDNGASVFFVD